MIWTHKRRDGRQGAISVVVSSLPSTTVHEFKFRDKAVKALPLIELTITYMTAG